MNDAVLPGVRCAVLEEVFEQLEVAAGDDYWNITDADRKAIGVDIPR